MWIERLPPHRPLLQDFIQRAAALNRESGNHWQPTPIHATSPGEPDLLLEPTSVPCKIVDELVKKDYERQAMIYEAQYTDLFNLLREQTGHDNFSYLNISRINDIGKELIHNMTEKQPQWVFKRWREYDYRSTLEITSELSQIQRNTLFNSIERAKAMGGYLLYNWLQNAERVANGTMKNPEKMLLYSSHDGTLLALMNAMGVANGRETPYASSFIMEIFDNETNYEIELLFRNDTTKPPYSLAVPGCEIPCTVEKMTNLFRNMVVTSYEAQQALCGIPAKSCNES
ncbi:hypothetical protein KIN20_016041 [Parelaphostrongylus tenuis]|uniref:Lysosomal acid phosphatase n=1 Tax=Parelaphostrongylus tenuis TaxID=148309 RepID=A0AAD5QQG1_PARTN|nr:hypothetical protein KIN20_016041 [Parelaphostrongylus tenuis]